ncbi:uncharacterized protein [Physcomitrium patens]|uniref:Uncharacterized protein n=1 Tax=Physcomitrium patens TaxID=3218 RepID=A9SCN4_PHYPA|nr:uncharacterized protein LOC112292864 [Physcomitrium patens]XP_024397545.1 uncharacterized protein LOC112292864 [Physcomitrium patens]PNR39826.1 hypothetical protein PHYPA_020106 [Physcomitrium patens]|eukprot:XP_024397544.1 uncharacterized protein LOC112292864 [Physcomitrella patens]
MSSLTWSLGRVTLVFHCAIPSSRHSRSSSQQLSCRRLSCNCALPRLSTSATPKTLQSTIESLHSGPELQSKIIVSSSGPEHSSVQPDQKPPPFHDYHRSVLQSVLSLVVALTMTIGIQGAPSSRDTFEDVPQTLSGGDKGQRIQKPKSAKAESCTRKCVSTCIRGGAGAPGEGPLNVRRPLVVFKEGFRSRQYCLIECSEICNLIGDGDDGP